MEKSNGRKIIIRNAIGIILIFLVVLFFRWNCLSEGQSRFANQEESTDKNIHETVSEVPKYVVKITGIEGGDSDNIYHSSGIILGFGDKIFILTEYNSIMNASEVQVEFFNETIFGAAIEKVDINSGVAILSIIQSEVDLETRKAITKAEFGNADNVTTGQEIAMAGNPYGSGDYLDYGTITTVSEKYDAMDAQYRLLVTDIIPSGFQNGFIINDEGKVVSMVSETIKNESINNVICSVGITDIIDIINRICNNEAIPYLGIYGESYSQTEQGIILTEVKDGSPAWNSYLRAGDIILSIDGIKVVDMDGVQNILENKNQEDEVLIQVLSKGEVKVVLDGR